MLVYGDCDDVLLLFFMLDVVQVICVVGYGVEFYILQGVLYLIGLDGLDLGLDFFKFVFVGCYIQVILNW